MSLSRIQVAAPSQHYAVLVGDGVADNLEQHLDEIRFPERRTVVSSPRVWRLHGARVSVGVGGRPPVLVPDGERSKHLRTVLRIYDGLIGEGADRASGIVAVGGGVIGDMAGFAAATYLRGIPVAHVPTTLLAQVDSAIGGKTGVNLSQGKNLVGAFHQPAAVLIDPRFLATLTNREFRAGLYEVVKYAVGCSATLFAQLDADMDRITSREMAVLVPVIEACCRIKARVVAEDERELGARRVLNLGHTAGHAFEAVTGYARFRHGEAVAWGMRVAAGLSERRGRLGRADVAACEHLIGRIGSLPAVGDLRVSNVMAAIGRDKKMVQGRLNFVLPTGIGQVEIVQDVGIEELRAALVEVGCVDA